jgi:hypothetical protein
MRQIRNSVFETNSSSTHSIAIPKSCDNKISYISFHIGEFGWHFDEEDPADYLYTAIYETSETMAEVEDKLARLKAILEYNDIDYDFEEVKCRESNGWLILDNGYIDHGFELKDFVNGLLDDSDKLVRFLSDGLVFTGNDNCDTEESGFIDRREEFLDDYDWHSKTSFKIKNSYYMSNHEDYEWYWKGN